MLRPLGQLWGSPLPTTTPARTAAVPQPAAQPASRQANRAPAADTAPPVQRELRAEWIATVANIDWPSKPGLTVEQQKAELATMLDKAVSMGMNAIVFQVRPNCDSFYKSAIEPSAPELTGTMGRDPGYDPLAFAVEEAHKRGLQFHAWVNPFRAGKVNDVVSADHVSKLHPEWVKRYGDNMWLDPSNPQVQAYSQSVIMDIVKRYDIDAVHMDDYFYPYKAYANGKPVDFPDAPAYAAYQKTGGTLAVDDWRRDNINRFVWGLSTLIHTEKPQLQFGISPFGIWKPENPAGIHGMSAYDEIYADAPKWLKAGWVDYLAPQLYWPIDKPAQSFTALLDWWTKQNPLGRHVYAGMSTSSVGTSPAWPAKEIGREIDAIRAQPGADGGIQFSSKPLMRNTQGVADIVAEKYAKPALAPASPWLDPTAPDAPTATLAVNPTTGARTVSWKPADEADIFQWVVSAKRNGQWTTNVYPASKRNLMLGADAADALEISAVDRSGNESAKARVELPAAPALAARPTARATSPA